MNFMIMLPMMLVYFTFSTCSSITIETTKFHDNSANISGVLYLFCCNITIKQVSFTIMLSVKAVYLHPSKAIIW